MIERYKVSVEELSNICDPYIFPYATTEETKPIRELIGQERAMEALKYGLSIKRKGYNVFISGLTGTGRNTYSYLVANEFAKKKHTPKDWCYVYNFNKPSSPKAISLNAGEGRNFKLEVQNAIMNIDLQIPEALSSKNYENEKNIIYNKYDEIEEEILKELNKLASEYNFIFKDTTKGIVSIPLIEGKPMSNSELKKLSEEDVERIKSLSIELNQESYDYIKNIKDAEDELIEEIQNLRDITVLEVAKNYIDPIKDKYSKNEKIVEFLKALIEDIVNNYDLFLNEEQPYGENLILALNKKEDFLKRYIVNLFIDNGDLKGAPVVKEMNPSYYNLFGKIEYANEMGNLKTDHTRIRPGSLHEANGGYIIIQAKDILKSNLAWETLKRALLTETLKVENLTGSIVSETLVPESIPLDIKVIIIGDYMTYHILYAYDEEFKKLFKIKAEFDTEMIRDEENILKIGYFVALQCIEAGLKPFDRFALSKIINFSSRIAEDQNKLTGMFNELVDIIYEADGWAREDIVGKEDIDKAIEKNIYRNNSYEDKVLELIEEGVLLIDIEKEKVGEINGLSVIDLGQYSFGRPIKITANTYLGEDGIINIEKESEQSGNIHDKGVLIFSGYLREKYAKETELSLTCSITFEQSYDGIDGDSASSTELYALLSSLAEVPIKQYIGVTGSVNQKGIIQPIGGVNEKIEGFYKICKMKGLTGKEGVMIPKSNIRNLMLDEEVINSVKEGKFNIYAVETIDEGIEVLTGLKAGCIDDNGNYEEGSMNAIVKERLEYYSMLSSEIEG